MQDQPNKKRMSTVGATTGTVLGEVTLLLNGDPNTQQFTINIDGNNSTIPNIADPINDQDIANKLWTETLVSNATSGINVDPSNINTLLYSAQSALTTQPASATATDLINVMFGPAYTGNSNFTLSLSSGTDPEASVLTFLVAGTYSLSYLLNFSSSVVGNGLVFASVFKNGAQLPAYTRVKMLNVVNTVYQNSLVINVPFIDATVSDTLELKLAYYAFDGTFNVSLGQVQPSTFSVNLADMPCATLNIFSTTLTTT